MKPADKTAAHPAAPGFYLYTASSASSAITKRNVFYWVVGQQVADTLCRLFSKESSATGVPRFLAKCASEVGQDDQIVLEEALRWLELYLAEPDPSVFDPPPPKEMMTRLEYARRASQWEDIIGGFTGSKKNGPLQADDTSHLPHAEAGDPSPEKLGMSVEDRRNSGLNLLLLLAQAYYKILECAISTARWCCALDLELNESYLWTITNLKNLLANHEDLKDFPSKFEPPFPNLYPSAIRDVDWEDMVAPDVEQFLSVVQTYVGSKGIYPPEKSSDAWTFVEMFRPSVNTAIERAVVYNETMRKYARSTFGETGAGDRANQVPAKEGASLSPSSQSCDSDSPRRRGASAVSSRSSRQRRPVDRRKELIAKLKARHPTAKAREICELIDRNTGTAPIYRETLSPLKPWQTKAGGKHSWVELYDDRRTRNQVRAYVNKVPALQTAPKSPK